MRKETIRKCRIGTAVLCGFAGFALAGPAAAKDPPPNAGGVVDIYGTVSAIREVPAGNPMPGLHVEARVKGQVTDIYIAPMDFVTRFGVKVAKGDDVRVIGTQAAAGDTDVVLAREVDLGSYGIKDRVFRPRMTYYLRNDSGPMWVEDTKGVPEQ
jgi:hypothetical protein